MESLILALAITGAPIDKTTFNNPLIEQQTAIVQPVEKTKVLTLQEKIDTNHYKCDEETQFIWASDATCHDKPVYTPKVTQYTPRAAVYSSGNTYSYGNCTFYAKQQLGWVPNGLGNANTWDNRAPSYGLGVYSTPIVGAVAQTDAGYYGHVGVVIAVNDTTVVVREMNWVGYNVVSTRTVAASSFRYIY